MDTYTLQRLICETPVLSPTARHVGMVLALAMDATTGRMRVRLDTLADQCGGYSKSTLLRGLNELIGAGLLIRQRTGRSAIYTAAHGIESGRVEVSPAAHQKCHPRHFDRPSEIFGNAEEGDKRWILDQQ